jgi:hypothetical protein
MQPMTHHQLERAKLCLLGFKDHSTINKLLHDLSTLHAMAQTDE